MIRLSLPCRGVALGKLAVPEKKDQLYLLGNEAAALGAISAGSRFMASYPITPASEIMEYMIKWPIRSMARSCRRKMNCHRS